ncbi:MAG: hypothetical protein IJ540_09880 [Prevotella sp.]|nr:hypothetical protein [Prevotella sp.]
MLMCYPVSSPAAHGAWGTIPDGTSAALVAVRCLSVWPLGRQYLHLMAFDTTEVVTRQCLTAPENGVEFFLVYLRPACMPFSPHGVS